MAYKFFETTPMVQSSHAFLIPSHQLHCEWQGCKLSPLSLFLPRTVETIEQLGKQHK